MMSTLPSHKIIKTRSLVGPPRICRLSLNAPDGHQAPCIICCLLLESKHKFMLLLFCFWSSLELRGLLKQRTREAVFTYTTEPERPACNE